MLEEPKRKPDETFASRSFDAVQVVRVQATSLQLATAKLPTAVDKSKFSSAIYQWASSLTLSGQNMPFALPQKVDRVDTGFDIVFLKQGKGGEFNSVGKIFARVEEINGANVYMVRFAAGEMQFATGARQDPQSMSEAEVKKALDILVDVPVIMGTMGEAIKRSCMQAMPQRPMV